MRLSLPGESLQCFSGVRLDDVDVGVGKEVGAIHVVEKGRRAHSLADTALGRQHVLRRDARLTADRAREEAIEAPTDMELFTPRSETCTRRPLTLERLTTTSPPEAEAVEPAPTLAPEPSVISSVPGKVIGLLKVKMTRCVVSWRGSTLALRNGTPSAIGRSRLIEL
jgi:hypothetical protein